jgi:hypothetical protein
VHKPKLLQQQREITRRLSAVSLTEVTVNQTVVAEALEKFLTALHRPVLPIRWARDSRDVHAILKQAQQVTAIDNVKVNPGTFREAYIRKERNWIDTHYEVLGLAQNEVLQFVIRLMYENSPEQASGSDSDHAGIWYDCGNALDFAARAAAESAWAYEYYETEERFRQYEISGFEKDWFPFVDAYEAGLWLFWLTDSEVVALSRPILRLNGSQVHSEDGPAVYWPEGEEQYFVINGVQVPREVGEKRAIDLDPRLLLHESNLAVRCEIVRKIGLERICGELATSVDQEGDYELLMLNLEDDKPLPFLKMKNPGTGAYHVEGVAPELRTVASALAWRNQTDVPPTLPGNQEVERGYRWYQQGEVTIKPVPKIPHRATLLNHRMLAEGRTTGSKHVALANDVRLFQHEEDMFMRAPTGTTVAHCEGDALQLPPGDYVVGVVRVHDHFGTPKDDGIY